MSSKGKLRACLSCSLVQTQAQFKREGCMNCDKMLEMKGSTDRVIECTTAVFDGCMAMVQPDKSWVAKFQRVEDFVPGVYAAHTQGLLPVDDQDRLEERGWVPRGKDD